jgi:hypothetical protein
MPSSSERVSQLVQAFLAGQPFMDFWRAFMDFNETEPDDFSPAEAADFDALYDLVYMAGPGAVAPEDAAVGLIGETELRTQLRQSRWAGLAAPPA